MTVSRAPGELEIVRAFVNTLEVEDGSDELESPEALARWLRERGLMHGARASRADLFEARRLREALRALLLVNNGVSVRKEAAATLDRAARRTRLAVRFGPGGTVRAEPAAGGVEGALGRLLGIVAAAMADGSWARLKACRADDCRWAFYDRARNRSRHWCSMAVCGNRTKARAYRRRHAA
ncbi:MAG TPA: CGNR zinc finger domain-containing protein [Gaiellaceae bacterium]|nr:CGNR zinc finger domain-containing protein [Gaiellaceae bacterium]